MAYNMDDLHILQQIALKCTHVASVPGHYCLPSFVMNPTCGQKQTQHIGTGY